MSPTLRTFFYLTLFITCSVLFFMWGLNFSMSSGVHFSVLALLIVINALLIASTEECVIFLALWLSPFLAGIFATRADLFSFSVSSVIIIACMVAIFVCTAGMVGHKAWHNEL